MLSLTILIIAAFACISDAQSSDEGLQYSVGSPKQWFIGEQNLLNDEVPLYDTPRQTRRYKRSYGGSYQTKGGYNSGSWEYENKLNQGYQNGLQKGMKCFALARTATDQWCINNCQNRFCPKHVCACTDELYNRALKPSYSYSNSYSKSGQYVKPSYGYQQTLGSYGQSTYGQSNFGQQKYSKTGSFGGYQQSGGLSNLQTSQQIEPRFEQQVTEF